MGWTFRVGWRAFGVPGVGGGRFGSGGGGVEAETSRKVAECETRGVRHLRFTDRLRRSLSDRSDQDDRRTGLGNPGSRGASTPGREEDAERRATRIDSCPTSISLQLVDFIRYRRRIWQADPTLVPIPCALAADLLLTGQIHRFYDSPEIAPGRCPSASTLGPKTLGHRAT